MQRTAVTLAGLALVIGGLAGCGGNDDDSGKAASAPASASTEDFCGALTGLLKDASTITGNDVSAQIKSVKKWAGDLDEVGTPADMPADAKEGLDIFVDTVKDIDDDATAKDLQNLGADLSQKQQKAGQAFAAWAQQTCIDPASSSPSPSGN